jgi:hypothetical protein
MSTRGLIALILLCCASAPAAPVLQSAAFKHHVDAFNAMEPEDLVNHVPNAGWHFLVPARCPTVATTA